MQNEVRKGVLSAGHARALLAHPDPGQAALTVIARQLNVRQTEALAKRASAPESAPGGGMASPRQAGAKDPETEALAHSLSERLGLRVEIAFNGRTGTLSLHYRSLDQLDGIIALLSRE